MATTQERSNQEWLSHLRGEQGFDEQQQAHKALASYLYVVVYNYLKQRQGEANPIALARYPEEDLAALSQDFVQATLEKLSLDNFALLDRFKGTGRFTSWAAKIVTRLAGQELRQSYWARRQHLAQPGEGVEENKEESLPLEWISGVWPTPEEEAIQQELIEMLNNCLEQIREARRIAVVECIIHSCMAKDVAERLEKTEQAIHLLVYRAKRDLRRCLQESGLSEDVLHV